MPAQTLALFGACPIRSKALAKGTAWLRQHRVMVETWATDLQLDPCAVRAAIDQDLAAELPGKFNGPGPEAADGMGISAEITVVIPCHNYACFLQECLDSLAASTLRPVRVIVIDDASDFPIDTTLFSVPDSVRLEFHRVDLRDQSKVCQFGFSLVDTSFCCFLDADDKVDPQYFQAAVEIMHSDRETAFVYPVLQAFGDFHGCCHGTDRAPELVRWQDLESRNWAGAGTLFRSEVLRSTLALKLDRVPDCGCNDWITARTVLRAGPWNGRRCDVPIYYRVHAGQMHTRPGWTRYNTQANLQHEIVTIVVAFSGRWNAWWLLRDWIFNQTWPYQQTRLMILNSTHTDLTAKDFGLHDMPFCSLQIERIDVGRPRLANEERRNAPQVGREVEAAVAGLYNRAIQMAFGEWMLFVEDDVIPQRPDAIAKLMESIGPHVACVSGLYKHRYEDSAVAFGAPQGKLPMRAMDGPEIERVTGTGFGCLLARRSVLSRFALSGDDPRCKFYDVNIGVRIAKAGYQWILDRSVYCEHLV
jgi:hypothetical protein